MKCMLVAFLFLSNLLHAQTKIVVQILPTDTEAEIIRKAANVLPSAIQLCWQQLELTAFLHFGINTFTNMECGDGKQDISKFNLTQLV